MPKQTVYIRDEDLELWKNLENKSDVISKLLRELNPPTPGLHSLDSVAVFDKEDDRLKPNLVKTAEKALEKRCKHGFPPSFCKFAKPGKPCR